MSTHYTRQIMIAQVDQDDKVIGPVERWKAHTENVLHRAISVVIYYEDHVYVQHRKHPLFDGWFDVTIASHQVWDPVTGLQDDIAAVYDNLKREWGVAPSDLLKKPEYMGKIYYHAEDVENNTRGYLNPETAKKLLSEGKHFHEQEFDYFYRVDLKKPMPPVFDYCYGYSLVPLVDIKSGRNGVAMHLTPWIAQAIKDQVL